MKRSRLIKRRKKSKIKCPACHDLISKDDEVSMCPEGHIPIHTDCAEMLDFNCPVIGCQQKINQENNLLEAAKKAQSIALGSNASRLKRPIIAGLSIKDIGIITGSIASFNLMELSYSKLTGINLGNEIFGLGSVIGILIFGIGSIVAAEQTKFLKKGSSLERNLKIATIIAAGSKLFNNFYS